MSSSALYIHFCGLSDPSQLAIEIQACSLEANEFNKIQYQIEFRRSSFANMIVLYKQFGVR